MGETRKIAVSDVVGYSRLAAADEDRPHSDSVLQIAASAANLSFTEAPVWGISVKTFSVRLRIALKCWFGGNLPFLRSGLTAGSQHPNDSPRV
jgi:hypothetical protein